MKRSCFVFLFAFGSWNSLSAALNYTETNLTATFAYNTSPTVLGECPPGCDDALTNPYAIGFTFQFGSVLYTQFLVSSNGWMTFNTGCISSDPANQLAGNATQTANAERPIIAPLWDDLDVDATGNVNYKLTGSPGSRILTVEWKKMRWKVSALGPVISFQVKLYEGTNVIDFCYRQETSAVSAGTASIGLEGPSGTDYYSLTNTTASPGVNHNASEVTTLNARPATDQVYRWTNNAPNLPVELTLFTGMNAGKENNLYWSAASQTINDYFTVEHSANGAAFTEVARVDGAGSCSMPVNYSAVDPHPFAGTTYYRLKMTDFNGGYGYSATIAINSSEENPRAVYPNPASDVLIVTAIESVSGYSIVDLTGRVILKGELAAGEGRIDVSQLSGGVYFLLLDGMTAREIVISRPER